MEDYLLTLPDEVLINEVLPRVPLTEVNRLCQVHSRFAALCSREEVVIDFTIQK